MLKRHGLQFAIQIMNVFIKDVMLFMLSIQLYALSPKNKKCRSFCCNIEASVLLMESTEQILQFSNQSSGERNDKKFQFSHRGLRGVVFRKLQLKPAFFWASTLAEATYEFGCVCLFIHPQSQKWLVSFLDFFCIK